VISIEPQLDLCVSLRRSVVYNGFVKKASVFCGAFALLNGGEDLTNLPLLKFSGADFGNAMIYRYHGKAPMAVQALLPPGVPQIALAELLAASPTTKIKFVKIDTDRSAPPPTPTSPIY
jgi:hypothetical protein